MASDLSTIIKDEISNTLESLLSVDASIESSQKVIAEDMQGQQCIRISIDYEFSKFSTVKWTFFIPTVVATKFEFLMLGGIGDLKDTIDDEISDAVSEIISNICGSISTAVSSQGFDDIGSAKFKIIEHKIIQCESVTSLNTMFNFNLKLDDDNANVFLDFEEPFLQYISLIATGEESLDISNDLSINQAGANNNNSAIVSLLGEDSLDNLKLLFNIKLKLSIRLGVKTFLLKDILNWDTGTIIELEQMVNEPLDILANGIKIGTGEAVIVDGKFGIKIKNIGDKKLI